MHKVDHFLWHGRYLEEYSSFGYLDFLGGVDLVFRAFINAEPINIDRVADLQYSVCLQVF